MAPCLTYSCDLLCALRSVRPGITMNVLQWSCGRRCIRQIGLDTDGLIARKLPCSSTRSRHDHPHGIKCMMMVRSDLCDLPRLILQFRSLHRVENPCACRAFADRNRVATSRASLARLNREPPFRGQLTFKCDFLVSALLENLAHNSSYDKKEKCASDYTWYSPPLLVTPFLLHPPLCTKDFHGQT